MYEVVVLIEEPMADGDARQLADLYGDDARADAPARAAPDVGRTDPRRGRARVALRQRRRARQASRRSPRRKSFARPRKTTPRSRPTPRAGLLRTLEHLRKLGLDADGELIQTSRWWRWSRS